MMFSNTAATSVTLNDRRGMTASAVRVYSSMTKGEPDVPAAGGHVGVEVEADHVHRILGRQALLLSGPGSALLPHPGFIDQAFVAPEPAHPFGVQGRP